MREEEVKKSEKGESEGAGGGEEEGGGGILINEKLQCGSSRRIWFDLVLPMSFMIRSIDGHFDCWRRESSEILQVIELR